ncbi:YbfB/YjiJ family MFS transporter [Pseudomonas veronii]|uniref:YbfB/YjiJ family MFS transporter n=1 Tax=Pseudomonas veronii TaxID=76761 RepID=UPI0036F267E5
MPRPAFWRASSWIGYQVTSATYLPLLVKNSLGAINPIHVWAIFGIGAAPSCYFWHKLHLRFGTHTELRANLIVQALGVVLPVILPNAAGYPPVSG